MDSKELIESEVNKVIISSFFEPIKKIAVDEAWKLLQIITATMIQIIEDIGKDLSGPEKKKIALDLIGKFYDTTFIMVDVPYVPDFIESYVRQYIKQFLMMLISSTIDSMVTIFRQTGVFLKKSTEV